MTAHPEMELTRRDLIADLALRLHQRFGGVFGVETIEAVLVDEFDRFSDARIEACVPLLAERYARERLTRVATLERPPMVDAPTVLFLCVHNAGRSQMAAGWLRHLAGEGVNVLSAGSAPAEQINPAAVDAMAEVGVDITGHQPRTWTDADLESTDVVITMGCGDACPVLPGKRYLDWELADPAGRGVEAVRPIRDEIERRVRDLLDVLDLPTTP